jgi:hypothetical protein
LPGAPLPNPGKSSDITAKRAFDETTAVAEFYSQTSTATPSTPPA